MSNYYVKKSKDCEPDEEILQQTKLPPWMELETIYYFEDKEILTNAPFVGIVEIKYDNNIYKMNDNLICNIIKIEMLLVLLLKICQIQKIKDLLLR